MALPGPGRLVDVYKGTIAGGVKIACATSKTITINNEPIDITSDCDDGYRTMLADPGVRSMDISVEGVAKSDSLIAQAVGAPGVLLQGYEIDVAGVGVIAGDFYLNSVEIGAPTAESITFTASLQSSGQFTYTSS